MRQGCNPALQEMQVGAVLGGQQCLELLGCCFFGSG